MLANAFFESIRHFSILFHKEEVVESIVQSNKRRARKFRARFGVFAAARSGHYIQITQAPLLPHSDRGYPAIIPKKVKLSLGPFTTFTGQQPSDAISGSAPIAAHVAIDTFSRT